MNTKLILDNFFLLLFIFPLTHILGVAVSEVFILFYLIFLIFNNYDKNIIDYRVVYVLLLFSAYVGINASLQIPSNLKYSSIFHFRYVLFSIAVCFFFEKYSHKNFDKRILIFSLFFIVTLLIFDSFYQFLVGSNIFGQKLFDYRVSSFFGEELILGSFLIRIFPIIIWYLLYLNFNFKLYNIYLIIFFSLYFISVYLSGERTSFALLIGQIFLLMIFITFLRKILAISSIFLLLFIVILATFNFGKTDITHRMFNKTFKQITGKYIPEKIEEINQEKNLNLKSNKLKIFSNNHQGHLILAKDLFESSLIYGVGPKGFRHFCRTVNYDPQVGICSTHPHNILAQILSELGLVGLSFYLIFIYFLIITVIKISLKKEKNLKYEGFTIMAIGLIVHLFPFLPSGNFFNNWISSFLYFKLGLLLFSYNKLFLK